MGLTRDALVSAANQQLQEQGPEFFDAPLRLQNESYEAFARSLHSQTGQDGSAQLSVADELRSRGIDPEVFYGNAQRLGVREFRADDLDPASGPCTSSATMSQSPPTQMSIAALLASDSADASDSPGRTAEMVEALAALAAAPDLEEPSRGSFDPPSRGANSIGEEPISASRQREIESHVIEGEADNALRLGMCDLNMPGEDGVEIPVIDTEEEETRGGRLSCETPKGMEAKLQIDSLTDDEDDDFLQTAPAREPVKADEEDEIEAFTLDPDFDYDKVDNLSRRC